MLFRTLSKVSKTWGFCSISKNDGRRGTFEGNLQRCRLVGILEYQICRFAKMILRDRCSTSHDLVSVSLQAQYFRLVEWKNALVWGYQRYTFPFHSSRKSYRIALFLMLSKIEEVSQNCFVLEVVKFKNCRRLVELFRFCCCQRRKMRKSRRSASFSSWQIADTQGDDRQRERERER